MNQENAPTLSEGSLSERVRELQKTKTAGVNARQSPGGFRCPDKLTRMELLPFSYNHSVGRTENQSHSLDYNMDILQKQRKA